MGKTAFVLSGGGAKGAFQVGVLDNLITKQGIKPDTIYGTSVGALNAAGYAYLGVEGLKEIWFGLRKSSDIIKFNPWAVLLQSKGVYSTDPLFDIIKKVVVDESNTGLNALPVVCYVNIATGSIIYQNPYETAIKPLTFAEAILASSSIPLAMVPVKDYYVDGGVREVTPLKQAVRDGHDAIYVLLANEYEKNPDKGKELKNWLCFGYRAMTLAMHEIFLNDISTCLHRNIEAREAGSRYKPINLHIFAPDETLIETLEFNADKIMAAYEQGLSTPEISDPSIIHS